MLCKPSVTRAPWLPMFLVLLLSAATGSRLVGAAPAAVPSPIGKVRTYYIQAEEIDYDYAPSGRNLMEDVPLDDAEGSAVFTKTGEGLIGRVYKKALYREYTDNTFAFQKNQPAWLGGMGPVLRAEVGDTLQIVFRNAASKPYSMHPHGVLYDHIHEGAKFANNTKDGNVVQPDSIWTYSWGVPERSGPGPADPSSILWMYHSHVDDAMDLFSGLYGPIIIYREGMLDEGRMVAADVDREFVVTLAIMDENKSHYLEENISRSGANLTGKLATLDDPDFIESNMMHSINTVLWANLKGLTMHKGEKVRWYTAAFGNELDMHTLHWHGDTLLDHGRRVDVVDMLPSSFRVLDMEPDATGKWLLHCHVTDHMAAGMNAYYTVLPELPTPTPSADTAGITPPSAAAATSPILAIVVISAFLVSVAALAVYVVRKAGRKPFSGVVRRMSQHVSRTGSVAGGGGSGSQRWTYESVGGPRDAADAVVLTGFSEDQEVEDEFAFTAEAFLDTIVGDGETFSIKAAPEA